MALSLTYIMLALAWRGVVTSLLDWYGDRAETRLQQRLLVRRMTALDRRRPGHPTGATLAANMTNWEFREGASPAGAQ